MQAILMGSLEKKGRNGCQGAELSGQENTEASRNQGSPPGAADAKKLPKMGMTFGGEGGFYKVPVSQRNAAVNV